MNPKTAFSAVLIAALTFTASAADKVWTNGTGDGKWSTKGNWSDNAAPTVSDAGYTITVSDTSANDIAGLHPTSLILTGASAVNVSGQSLTITGGVTFNATADSTLSLPIVLSGSGRQQFGGSSTKTLTLSGVVSGEGGIEQNQYFPLVLSGANTFEGGYTQTKGQVKIANGDAFGKGAVVFTGPQKVGSAYVTPFVISAANLTIPNDVTFPRDGYSGEGHKGSVSVAKGTVFSGYCDFSNGGMRLTYNDAFGDGAITFNGIVKLNNYTGSTYSYQSFFIPKTNANRPIDFYGRITNGGVVFQDDGGGLFRFHAAGNELNILWLRSSNINAQTRAKDAFTGSTLVVFDNTGNRTGQVFDLCGYDQTIASVYEYTEVSAVYTHTVKGGTARLTMKSTADRTFAGKFSDDLTVCWMPTTAKTYTLKFAASDTTGGLVVSNGMVSLESCASFPNATRLEVASGATFAMAAGTSFNASAARLDLATGATLNLADGVNLAFESVYLDGNRLSGGETFSSANPIAGVTITGGGSVSVPIAPVPATRTATWSGGGGANVLSDEGSNWEGGSMPKLDDGLTAVTFASGGTEAAAASAMFLNGILFNASADFSLSSVSDAVSVRLQSGGIDTASPASGTRKYTVAAPVDAAVDQTWNVAANTSLEMEGRLFGGTAVSTLLRTGPGTVNLSGTDDFIGRIVISNGVTSVRGDGLGHTNLGEVAICDWPQGSTSVTFTDATIEKPVLFDVDSSGSKYGYGALTLFNGTNTFNGQVSILGNHVRFVVVNDAVATFAGGMVNNIRYPVLRSTTSGTTVGTGKFVVTNTPLNLLGWWQETLNGEFAVSGNKFTLHGLSVRNTSTLRIMVDDAIEQCSRLVFRDRATIDLNGHDLYVGKLEDFDFADAPATKVASAAPAMLEIQMAASETSRCWIAFNDAAGLRKKGAGALAICRESSTTGTLEVAAGRLTLAAGSGIAGGWASGSEVIVGAAGRLVVERLRSVSRSAVVRVATGGVIELADGVDIRVAELWVDGVKRPNGSYTRESAPGLIAGAGTLEVGKHGFCLMVF